MHFLKWNNMSSTTDTLASYLADTHDAKGVVDFRVLYREHLTVTGNRLHSRGTYRGITAVTAV